MSESERSDEAEALADVDEVWLGDTVSVPGEQFVEMLQYVQQMQQDMEDIRGELADLQTGLDRSDTIDLLYGRNHGLSKSQVEAAFEVMDIIASADPEEMAPRLMADQTSDLTIAEAAEVWDELVRLSEKYGPETDSDTTTQ